VRRVQSGSDDDEVIVMRIGYLGVGMMGQPMAGKLLDAGHDLWVCDVRDEALAPLLERQARRASTPKDLADACETVVVSLPTLAIFRAALHGSDGLLAGGALKTLVNTCTVGGPFLDEVVTACKTRGVTVIDAPISGGVVGAKAGTLTTMASGDQTVIRQLEPVFKLWGPNVVNAGPVPGAAQTMKLTNNILFAVSLIATSEAMALAQKGGIPAQDMLQVLNNSTGRNFSTMTVFPQNVVTGTFDFGATLELLMKDVDLAIEQGESLGVPMWVCQAARLALMHCAFQGHGPQDLSRVAQVVADSARKTS
jgi:3-hydroxyisobutyrate dehydrogenase-like beta-hydroxyacid dehydrogenase